MSRLIMRLRSFRFLFAAVGIVVAVTLSGCVGSSGGTWFIKSAALPEGWPELTPVGEVHLREYPVYRAAVVSGSEDDDAVRPMFMELFDHIQRNDVSMTAPVDMGYSDPTDGSPSMQSMAFLYRTPQIGSVGEDGAVSVQDVAPQTFASVGMRGGYSDRNFEQGLGILHEWLEVNGDAYEAVGTPRFLGYNGPFVLPFLKYGEVQIPVADRR